MRRIRTAVRNLSRACRCAGHPALCHHRSVPGILRLSHQWITPLLLTYAALCSLFSFWRRLFVRTCSWFFLHRCPRCLRCLPRLSQSLPSPHSPPSSCTTSSTGPSASRVCRCLSTHQAARSFGMTVDVSMADAYRRSFPTAVLLGECSVGLMVDVLMVEAYRRSLSSAFVISE